MSSQWLIRTDSNSAIKIVEWVCSNMGPWCYKLTLANLAIHNYEISEEPNFRGREIYSSPFPCFHNQEEWKSKQVSEQIYLPRHNIYEKADSKTLTMLFFPLQGSSSFLFFYAHPSILHKTFIWDIYHNSLVAGFS